MKNLLFILPIIAFSFNLQAQQDTSVADSNRQFTDVEEEFLEVVRSGDTQGVIDAVDIGFMNGEGIYLTSNDELGEKALGIAIVNDEREMIEALWKRGARVEYEDGTIPTLAEIFAIAETFGDIRKYYTLSSLEDYEGALVDFDRVTEIEIDSRIVEINESIRIDNQDIKDKIDILPGGLPCGPEDLARLQSLPSVEETTMENIESVIASTSTSCSELMKTHLGVRPRD